MTTLSNLSKYGSNFQTKVIGALLTQKNFLVNVSDSLDKEYFENSANQWIIDKTLAYLDRKSVV